MLIGTGFWVFYIRHIEKGHAIRCQYVAASAPYDKIDKLVSTLTLAILGTRSNVVHVHSLEQNLQSH